MRCTQTHVRGVRYVQREAHTKCAYDAHRTHPVTHGVLLIFTQGTHRVRAGCTRGEREAHTLARELQAECTQSAHVRHEGTLKMHTG